MGDFHQQQLLDLFKTQFEKRNDVIKEMQISDETAKLIQEKILDQKNKDVVYQLYFLLKKIPVEFRCFYCRCGYPLVSKNMFRYRESEFKISDATLLDMCRVKHIWEKLFPDITERFGSWQCTTFDYYKKNIDDEKKLDQLLIAAELDCNNKQHE